MRRVDGSQTGIDSHSQSPDPMNIASHIRITNKEVAISDARADLPSDCRLLTTC